MASIATIVLSITQAFAIFPDTIADYHNMTRDSWQNDCDMALIQYISPFNVAVSASNGTYQGCGWRVRSTVFRVVICVLLLIASPLGFMAVFKGKSKLTARWMHWLLFVLMFIVFVLDVEALDSGYSACQSDFKLKNGNGDT